MPLDLVATCALGLEEILAAEVAALGGAEVGAERGAVTFRGSWPDVYRANLRLRTANRVLVALGSFPAADGDALAEGAGRLVAADREGPGWDGLSASALFRPERSFSLRATSRRSRVRDVRWVALRVKDGLVDAQRERWGRRSSVDRARPDLALRVFLDDDVATLLLDTSGEPLDRRGYRIEGGEAPLRETLAAAAVLAAGWDGRGPVVDPMCGSATLLAEAGLWARGIAPGFRRERWAFERLPVFRCEAWATVRGEVVPAPAPAVDLVGCDRDPAVLAAARANLERAGLAATLVAGDAFELEPPAGPGLLLVNPPYGERMAEEPEQWRRLGDLLKRRFAGYRAVVVAGGPTLGKHLGLRPRRRLPVRNGPLEARLLVFDLY